MKKLFFAAVSVAFVLASCSPKSGAPQQKLCAHDDEINEIIAGMTLDEKVLMLHSKTNMSSEGIPRLGIQEIRYADGPFGIREEGGEHFEPLHWTTDSSTYFPTGSALAATWSREIAYKYGTGMGREGRIRGKDIILGPAINIQRLPVGGRSYEYLSEDPFLSAALTVGYTKGSQDAGTAVCLKHFAVNNQELDRGSVNAVVDERTLREIYLKPFQAGVEEGGAMAIMTAYNKVNGFYMSEQNHINNEILRGEWGFKGMTISDWGGTHSTMGAALGGLDVQMTGDRYFGKALADSVRSGAIPESVVDDKVREILRVRYAIEAIPADKCNIGKTSLPEQQQIAYEVATKSIVLLKNDENILPIDINQVSKIAVVGPGAELKTALGGGGAGVKAPYEITALQGLKDRVGSSAEILYSADDVEVARDADVVLFIGGTDREIESEGRDRKDIFLPGGQDELLTALAAVNPNIVTVILSGGPCDLRNAQSLSKGLVQGWWNGLENGHALADVLLGKIAPSGKLPFTFPVKLEDSPAFALGVYPHETLNFGDLFAQMYRPDRKEGAITPEMQAAMRELRQKFSPVEEYKEGLYVGYRWYDTKKVPVLYAFGYGLSYVDFEYSDIKVAKSAYGADDVINVTLNVRNTGDMPAEEVVQLYVKRIDGTVEYPEKELKGFERVALEAGQTGKVTIKVPVSELRFWDVENSKWSLDSGRIEILVGSASDDIRLTASTSIK